MQPERYHGLARNEDVVWWHRARRAMAARILKRAGMPEHGTALDVGCGTGGTFGLFETLKCARSVGVDVAQEALNLARGKRPDAMLVHADASAPLPFRDEAFDLITVFNVLCHAWVVDEARTVRQLAALMKPGGLIVITEPAFPLLSRRLDTLVMSKRRYRVGEITEMAVHAGLQPVRTGYFASAAFLPVLALVLLERLRPRRASSGANADADVPLDFRVPPAWLNRLFLFLTNLEGQAIAAGFGPPFGVTLIGVYRKPASAPPPEKGRG